MTAVRRNARLTLGVFWLALTGCDARSQATLPSGALPPAPPAVTASTHAPSTTSASVAAARSTGAASSALPELQVPASQVYEVSDLKPGEKRPLLIFLHGLGASGKIAFDVLHLAALGARERVFVVAPDGAFDSQKRQFWNAGPACCNFDHANVDDVARLGALIDRLRARAGVDPARVYLAGHSNGGFMTERLACAFGDRLAAAASLSGAAPTADITCDKPSGLALLEVHGDADEIVRYAGGRVFDNASLAPFPSAEQGFQDWAKRFGCSGSAQSGTELDLDPKLPGTETSVEQFASCARGSVALWTVHGGSHYVGTGQQAFEAVWRFLSAHHQ
ncbi:MAG TPA: PHB depolymerase family esterase [Polyangiaceae bacterium]